MALSLQAYLQLHPGTSPPVGSFVGGKDHCSQPNAGVNRRRIGSKKAAVAIARKMLVAVWYILTERTADRHADPDKVAFKYIMWSWKLDDVKRQGMSTRQWARYHLMRLQLGEDLTHIMRGGNRYPIAPDEEIKALLPDLQAAD